MDQICPRTAFPVKIEKSEQHHWLQHIRFSVGTKFQSQLTIFTFWTKFAQKGYFQSKTEKLNITIEFCMFELVYVPNVSLNWTFWFFGPNCPKQSISGRKLKKWTSILNSPYLNYFKYQVSPWTDNFHCLDQISPKRVFPIKSRKSEHDHLILHAQISVGSKFHLKLIILIFWTKISPRTAFPLENKKSEQHHWIQYVRISLGTKFQLQLIISIFWTKFAQKAYSPSKTENVNTTIEFCKFELV